MIDLTLTQFFVGIVVGPLVLVGLSSLWWRARERVEQSRARHRTNRCRYCGLLFQRAGERVEVEHCPGCRAAIRAGRDRRLG